MRKSIRYQIPPVAVLIAVIVILSTGCGPDAFAQEEDYFTFLPLTRGLPPQKIPNGDFESGRVIWTESSKWSNILIVTKDDLPRGISPHRGGWAAWLGGDNVEQASIEQTVLVDRDNPYLAFWYWIDWPFSCQGASGAVAAVSIDQEVVYQTDVCAATDTGGWIKQTVDVSAYADRSVPIRFELITGANSFANLYLDDVTFQELP